MTVAPIAPIGAPQEPAAPSAPLATTPGGFARMLADGVEQVNRNVLNAEQMVQAFTLDDGVPLHQVTFALEQARLSVELMMHVRSRLLEGYQELARMQL